MLNTPVCFFFFFFFCFVLGGISTNDFDLGFSMDLLYAPYAPKPSVANSAANNTDESCPPMGCSNPNCCQNA